MLSPALRSVVWKEYRQLRGLWYAMVFFTIVMQGVCYGYYKAAHWNTSLAYVIWSTGLSLTAIYGLAAAGVLFAGEREEETADFLARLPWSEFQIAWSKIGIGAVTIVLQLLACCVSAGLWLLFLRSQGELLILEDNSLFEVACLIPLFFLLGMTWSLLSRHVLWGVFLAGISAALICVNSPFRIWVFGIPVLLLINAALSRQWIRCPNPLEWFAWRINTWRNLSVKRRAVPQVEFWRRDWRPLQRSLWLEWQQAHWFVPIAVAPSIGLIVVTVRNWEDPHDPEFAAAVLGKVVFSSLLVSLAAAIAGVLCWSGELRKRHYLFQTDRGQAPFRLLFTKQLVWLPLVGFMIFSYQFLLNLVLPEESIRRQQAAVAMGVEQQFIGRMLAVFLWGELAALCCPSLLLAGCVSVVGGAGLFLVVTWLGTLHIPWVLRELPVLAVLAAALMWRVRDRLLDRPGWWPLAKIGVLLGTASAATLAGVACYRMWEIPDVEFPPEGTDSRTIVERLIHGNEEDRKLVLRFRLERAEMIDQHDARYDDFWNDPARGDRDGEAFIRRWHDENRKALLSPAVQQRIEASLKTPPSKRVQTLATEKADPYDDYAILAYLHSLEGKRLADEEGKLEEGLDELCKVLQIARLLQKEMGLTHWSFAAKAQDRSLRVLLGSRSDITHWSACKGQSAVSIQKGIDRLRQEWEKFLESDQEVLLEYVVAQAEGTDKGESVSWPMLWEQERARRIRKQFYKECYDRAKEFETAQRVGIDRRVIAWPDDSKFAEWYRSLDTADSETAKRLVSMALTHRKMRLAIERGTTLVMEICAYRLDQKKLPEQLSDLMLGKNLKSLPRDPYSGEDFHYLPHGFSELKTPNQLIMYPMPVNKTVVYRGDNLRVKTLVPLNGKSEVEMEVFAGTDAPIQFGDLFVVPDEAREANQNDTGKK